MMVLLGAGAGQHVNLALPVLALGLGLAFQRQIFLRRQIGFGLWEC